MMQKENLKSFFRASVICILIVSSLSEMSEISLCYSWKDFFEFPWKSFFKENGCGQTCGGIAAMVVF